MRGTFKTAAHPSWSLRASRRRPTSRGKTLATPQLGNTQDVALRYWLKSKGYQTQVTGSGDVTINPTDNASTLALFKTGKLDGAWLPEPWASTLVVDAGAKVLVDEASLWPRKTFPTTVLVVSRAVPGRASGHRRCAGERQRGCDRVAERAQVGCRHGAEREAQGGHGQSPRTRHHRSCPRQRHLLDDPVASSYPTLVSHAVAVGTGTSGSIKGLLDLSDLNALRAKAGQAAIPASGGE